MLFNIFVTVMSASFFFIVPSVPAHVAVCAASAHGSPECEWNPIAHLAESWSMTMPQPTSPFDSSLFLAASRATVCSNLILNSSASSSSCGSSKLFTTLRCSDGKGSPPSARPPVGPGLLTD